MAGATNLLLEDVDILFRNFAGREKEFNAAGDRNFSVLLDEATADKLTREGWNVKALRSRDEDEPPRYHLSVKVSFKIRPPRVLLLSSGGRTVLPEDLLDLADYVDVLVCDVNIRGSHWDVSGKQGIKAYLQTIYIKVREDPLDMKYADVPMIDINGQPAQITSGEDPLELEAGPDYIEGEIV